MKGIGQRNANSQSPATSPPPPAPPPTTYTTIPISGNDVISRSFYNISSYLSLRRPWTEFLAAGVFDRPESLSSAADRLRKNARYFRLNYAIIICSFALLSLIGAPLSLVVISGVFALWLVLYFFREDPLFFWGHYVSDRVVLIGLVSTTLIALWFTGVVQNLVIGLGLGLVVVLAVHGVFRNPDGLFLDENEAASTGLIGSGSNFSPDGRDLMR